jgi:hypothetical protein
LAAGVAMTACSGAAAPPEDASSTATPAAAAAGQAPIETEITIPAGTTIPIVLDTEVGSASSRVEEAVRAHVERDVMVNGVAAIPDGSAVHGVVTAAERSGKVQGRAHIAVSFDSVAPAGGDSYPIHATAVSRMAEATKGKDALEIGGGAGAGAIVGSLIGGKKGAAIGGVTGGAAGTGVVLSTRGKEVSLGAGARLSLRLTEPVTIRVKS